jgi:microcystin-dependent protein
MTITDIKDITSFKWATVRGNDPLSIQVDGDSAPLALIPDSLVDPFSLAPGDRVRVELSLRKVVVHGRSNGDSSLPGEVKITAVPTAPTGWLLCQGQSLLRTSYQRLFNAIGTTYGAADSTHFTLPDLRGRVAVGQDTAQTEFDTLGETGGRKTTAHGYYVPGINSGNAQDSGDNYEAASRAQLQAYLTANGSSTIEAGVIIQSVGGAIRARGTGGVEVRHHRYTAPNLQPYIALNYIIKI